VDLVVGPDAYKDLPNLLEEVEDGRDAINVILSKDETYGDISPVRLNSNGVTALVSITRGCDNMCSFCVVPFTRGRERSREPESIVREATELFNQGYKEVTLLGQNVDSYKWQSPASLSLPNSIIDETPPVNFAQLLEMVAQISPKLRIRFSSSHPKDITDEVLFTIKKYDNICNYIHYPVQSGNSRVLKMMNRTYNREWLVKRLARIREVLPDVGISTDAIVGFCSETEDEFQDTLSLFTESQFEFAFMYAYSERPGTLAERKYEDDVTAETKSRRLAELVALQNSISLNKKQDYIGKTYRVLIEGFSKKSDDDLKGRNDQNQLVVFPTGEGYAKGDYVNVLIERCTMTSLFGKVVNIEAK
jgi:tRNA-2-methylthio-N6-dimethylallyladenosine synthase